MKALRLLDRIAPGPILADLRHRTVNFDRSEVDGSWHRDLQRTPLLSEAPGQPEPNGAWETACRLLAAYEFADPSLIRAVYDESQPLLGRDMLLEGRFALLRFYMGVRVTDVIDSERQAQATEDGAAPRDRVWGWAYETLDGHLESGRMSYEVVKDLDSGRVEFVIEAYSHRTPTLGPVTGLGWRVFGRRTQLRFYRSCARRLAGMVAARTGEPYPVPPRRYADGLVLAPSDARPNPWRWLSIRRHQPR